ncbi:TetR/AcrR family transcriptional regulator C-terminal domain-containing protein [Kitasatospora sp. GP82]|uniref:TetR/AcrR family transcriptional regulator C-terminal domain-containing protein n=1 Tax=Kitasatospora sp. GP82 TaxID=3035089 RepID=UPI0024762827|nr:TetR/AcrR family transcriptional regulator C-terminal domain-containing protein [Kitasatospora sp. GP82]MDH6124939.1 hypothetical protein [Kitasatospora sp. GP82]
MSPASANCAATGFRTGQRVIEPALPSILSGGRFPTFERLATVGYDFDLDELFEFGLQRLLDGISVLLDEKP